MDHLRTGYMLEVQRALTRGALPPSLPWDRRDGKGEETVERANCKCQRHDRFHPRETGNRDEVGGEGRRYFCNRVVKYYRENTVTCAYAPKADLTSILRG